MEEWRSIPGHEAWEASSAGRIRNARTKRILKKQVCRSWSGNLYEKLQLGHGINRFVQRLVAAAFHGTPAEGMEADHLNKDTMDNRAENLEWVSGHENRRRRDGLGEAWEPSGEVDVDFDVNKLEATA